MMTDNANKALIDNWSLELAAQLICGSKLFSKESKRGLLYESRSTGLALKGVANIVSYMPASWYNQLEYLWGTTISSDSSNFSRKQIEGNRNAIESGFRFQLITALSQLLDLIVMYDGLIVDSEMSIAWERHPSMQPLIPIISKVRLGRKTKQAITDSQGFKTVESHQPIVSQGALYYLGLSRLLGVDYWPSPERSVFLKEHLFEDRPGFVKSLNKLVDKNISDLIKQATAFIHDSEGGLLFPGFGTTILANCENRSAILETAFEFRNTKECQVFRSWLREMDQASSNGNIQAIAKNLQELKSVMFDIRRRVGLENAVEKNMTLEVGLSPSLSIDTKTIKSLLESIKTKPLHLVFLRNHFNRVLENANLWKQVWRLFPEIQLSDISQVWKRHAISG